MDEFRPSYFPSTAEFNIVKRHAYLLRSTHPVIFQISARSSRILIFSCPDNTIMAAILSGLYRNYLLLRPGVVPKQEDALKIGILGAANIA